jgi:hypothetical protein
MTRRKKSFSGQYCMELFYYVREKHSNCVLKTLIFGTLF